MRPTLEFLSVPIQAFYDLTRASCARFNAEVPMPPGIRCFSVAGKHDGSYLAPEWLLPYHIVRQAEGENDGVVSLESAKFGEDQTIWDGDHFSLVNWLHPLTKNRDPAPRYGAILRRLADEGF